jgi:hypothetical protein
MAPGMSTRLSLLILAALARVALAAEPGPPASGLPPGVVDPAVWTVVRTAPVRGLPGGDAVAALLRSTQARGTSGVDEPLHQVDLLIWQGGRVAWRFSDGVTMTRDSIEPLFQTDDALEVRDVTGDGAPEVLFHSGFTGVSDFVRETHIAHQSRQEGWWSDVRRRELVQSALGELEWRQIDGRSVVLVARPLLAATPDAVGFCHICPRYYEFLAFVWDARRDSLVLAATALSRDPIEPEDDALVLGARLLEPGLRATLAALARPAPPPVTVGAVLPDGR